MTQLKPGTVVKLNQPPHLNGVFAKVVGRATDGAPVIGISYILKPEDPSKIYSKEYPYEYMCAPECMFDVVYIPEFHNTRTCEYPEVEVRLSDLADV
jgi:hypothetical protein